MPLWSGATYNYVNEVRSNYITIRARVVNGVALKKWKHHFVDIEKRKHLVDADYWKTANFTMLVFCPFDTTKGGSTKGNGKMTFGDFYPGECSNDGRLCSFLSRSRTKLFPDGLDEDSDDDSDKKAKRLTKRCKRTKACTYFRGKSYAYPSALRLLLGYIDRSCSPKEQGPIELVERQPDQWTCETGILEGHQPNAIERLMQAFPVFKDGDFSRLIDYMRPNEKRPPHAEL